MRNGQARAEAQTEGRAPDNFPNQERSPRVFIRSAVSYYPSIYLVTIDAEARLETQSRVYCMSAS